MLRNQASLTLGVVEGRIDPRVSLTSMGLDSLMAVELRNSIEARTGVSLPLGELLEGPSLTELLDRLLLALDASGQPAAAVPVGMDSAAAVALLAKVDEISDAEVEALLGQILPGRRDRP
jgi:acyl carrier protein